MSERKPASPALAAAMATYLKNRPEDWERTKALLLSLPRRPKLVKE